MRYVLYHSNCYDGFGAAFAAWKKFGYENTKYIPVTYGEPPPEMLDANEIYIVDFSYDADILESLAMVADVTVLDHHKTAEAKLAQFKDSNNPKVLFDMNRSGALITWEYFHAGFGIEVPRLIQHISDRDLWTYKIPGSREVHAALVSLPFDFEIWDKLDTEKLIVEGEACLRFQSQLVQNIVAKSWLAPLDEYVVPVVNTASPWSEVGEALIDQHPECPFAACFTVRDSYIQWSLRSRGDFDVSTIAKKYGGGGHKNAAGFSAPTP